MDALRIGDHPGCVDVRIHDSVDEFRAIAEPLYRRDPVKHTVELTLLNAGRIPENSLLLTVWDDGDPVGAALQTPPYPLVCNGIPVIVSGRVTTAWRESIRIWMACAVGVIRR